MKKIIFTLIFILIFCAISFAQTVENSPCPHGVTVNGPAVTSNPGEPQIFTATVEDGTKDKIRYVWSVKNGKIIKGQGTRVITVVQTDELAGSNLTATVVIQTPSEGCGTISDSRIMVVIADPLKPHLIDEFPPFSSKLEKEKLTNFAVLLQNSPSAQGYIIGKFNKDTSENSLKNELMKISNFLVKERTIEANRITVISGFTEGEETIQLWIVPAGASEPTELKKLTGKHYFQPSGEMKEILPCPDGVTVTGPDGIIPNGQLTSFTARIHGEVNYEIKYVWKVENGTIVEGQGASKVTVLKTAEDGGPLWAFVTIDGLPKRCEILSASEMEIIP